MLKLFIKKLFSSKNTKNKPEPSVVSNRSYEEDHNKDINTSKKSDNGFLKTGKTKTILVPDFGNEKKLTITKWFFKSGDIVNCGDILCELENDKATMEFESYYDGKISIIAPENAKLKTGMELCKIDSF